MSRAGGSGTGTGIGRARPSGPRTRVSIGNRRAGGAWWRLPLVAIAWLIVAAPLGAALVALAVLDDYARDLPAEPDLDAWQAALPRTSSIRAADGTILAEIPFRADEVEIGNRRWVAYGDIPPLMVKALIAAEDERFFQHRGVDLEAVARAAWANYQAGHVVEGASTITQQVARALLPREIGREQSLRRKVREALVARRLERHYDKRRILEVYANQVFLGAGAYGVAAAARAYFDRPLGELGPAEAALVAGLAQAPGRASPYVQPAAARARRDHVLDRMRGAGFLTEPEYRLARAAPVELHPPVRRYGQIAPWSTERARREVAAALPVEYARGGLSIETAALPVLAAEVEDRARRHAAALRRDGEPTPQVAALLWDQVTDYLEAEVGGLRWEESSFDRTSQACRQPGSAFKPVLYAAALAAGAITPGTPLRDGPISEYDERLDVHWKPRNGGRAFRGVALAQDALAASLNAPAVDVLDRVGGPRVIAMARRLGLSTPLDDVRPLALGASCVIPIELAGAFAAFARGGRAGRPITVVRVWRDGAVLVDRASPYDPWIDPARRLDRLAALAAEPAAAAPAPALDPETAFLVAGMLRDVVLRGTGSAARDLGRPAAGKTGTTNGNTDAWFIGFTARLLAAVWIGHDDPSRQLGAGRDGAHAALPLWMELVALSEASRAARPVPAEPPPPGVVRAVIDRETGLLAEPGAGGAVELWFRRGTEPHERAGDAPGVPADLSRASREF
ncbi:MAG TPA: transglycosylase domain-containing protein [Kofleriaceae bacterium]|nr:transglycosylase domain-containing protein [Kofleriaceae bacterium]